MSSLQTIGKKTVRAQDRIFDEARLVHRVEARLFHAGTPLFTASPKRRRRRLALVAAAVVAIAVAALLLISLPKAPPLQVLVNGRSLDVIQAPVLPFDRARDTALTFSDGSTVRMGKAALARFISVSPHGADIRVEDGHLFADIAHVPNTDWKFHAGPYEVKVTGTRFDLTFEAETDSLVVAMVEGSVEISAPFPARPQWVRAGETFRGWARQRRMELATHAQTNGGVTSAVPVVPEATPDTVTGVSLREAGPTANPALTERKTHVASRPPEVTPKTSPPDCPESDATATLSAADAHRRRGEVETAISIYLAVRRCFPERREAALAAFDLGKTAFDDRRDFDEAALWLETYLREQKNVGPAREALGRLLEAYVLGHHPESAREAAKRYLKLYPNGPHAAFARAVIEEESDSATHP